ncbi:MAG: phenylalanine--tRNA ligase subunit beta [Pigmentiphaga sp.]|uniref:phenylalanine--tRNA ligase subunit beta n=1 Tax=Pigmentiphaga sp. TaxID=1977564 RepID=UPI0029B06277|nr:phenylalanine--tRNA ligase subunit beta [Pigmentiphaga sp.]MDX3905353.1 phenylalanine--tRNA ligase subunit beta [Pigmentiphaga sp.]
MQFPESWLRSLTNPAISTEELAHQLTMAGLEVEETAPVAPAFSGVVVAQVLSVEPHPNADKLRVCRVDAGQGEPLQIVCGAPNVAAGMKVPLATVGARLPGDIKIGVAKMRGVESAGMLCSARELGLSQDHAGLLDLGPDATVGMTARDWLQLDDTVFTLKLTPNKADCLSVLGVAREVSALTGAPLTRPSLEPVPVSIDDRVPVTLHAPDLCGRYVGRVIRGVNAAAPTPDWIRRRLERAGQRPISALVDISNYVMLELGRPSHVFDLAKVQGGLHVRWGEPGEKILLLNGQTVDVDGEVGVIADDHGPECLAGIMGGESTSVSTETRDVYVEAAFWWPGSIAGRARRYNFSTDASYRFERGVDYANIPADLEYLTSLIVQVCGGQAGPVDDQVVQLPERAPVRMRVARCHKVLGVQVPENEIADIFTRLGLPHTREPGVFVVTPPSFRFDLEIEEDLIEEVARIHGFERLPDVPPMARAVVRTTPEERRPFHVLRHLMADLDYQEVINFSFVEADWERDYAGNDDPIRLLNPIASQLSVMRSTLIGGLVANTQYNVNRKTTRVRVFELGRVFRRDPSVKDGPLTVGGVSQPMRLAALAYGPAVEEQWGTPTRQVDFYDVKADLEALLAGTSQQAPRFVPEQHPALHPGRSARIVIDGEPVGWIGELHPRWVQRAELPHAPVVFELDAGRAAVRPLPLLREISRQPVVVRDLALLVPEAALAQQLLDTINHLVADEPELAVVKDVRIFDVWRDKSLLEKEKSLAFRFWLQDTSVTLDDARVESCLSRIRVELEARHGARLRV